MQTNELKKARITVKNLDGQGTNTKVYLAHNGQEISGVRKVKWEATPSGAAVLTLEFSDFDLEAKGIINADK